MLLPNIKYVVSILLTPAIFIANAQQDVKLAGIVIEQNSKVNTGKVVYIQGAGITAKQATPQTSDANGRFTLVFADMPPGNVALINVERDGYEVVNSKVLQAAAVTGRTTPLEIVMCKPGLLYQNQLAYYNIATGAAREQYEKKIKILETGGKNKDELIASLQKEMNKIISSKEEAINSLKAQYQFQLQQSQNLADKFVAVNLDDESETYQRAFKAFQNKDIEGAIRLLDSVNLEDRLASNLQQLQKEESPGINAGRNVEKRMLQIQQDVSQCMFKGRLHILRNDYKTATQSYLLALKYDSSNTDNLLEVATFLLNQHSGDLAKKYFDQLLSVTHTDYEKAVALENTGEAYRDAGAYEEAEKYYPQAIKIFEQLYQKDPGEYRVALTNTINQFGSLYYDWEFYSIAGNYFKQADDIYVQAYDSLNNPAITDAENLAWYDVLNNQCMLDYKYKNYYAAMRHSTFQAMPLLQKVAGKNPGLYALRLARAFFNQGLSEFYLKDYAHAGDDLSDGINGMRTLAEKSMEQYGGDLANMLDRVGQLCYELKVYERAMQLYNEALKNITEVINKNSSDLNLSRLAATLTDLGLVYVEGKDYLNAEQSFTQALNIVTELAAKKPSLYAAHLAKVNNGLAGLYFQQKYYQKAAGYFNNALDIYKTLAEKNPQIYAADNADVLDNLGALNLEQKKYDIAENYYLQALAIQIQLINAEKKSTIEEKSDALVELLAPLSKTLNGIEILYHNGNGKTKPSRLYADARDEYKLLSEKNKVTPVQSVMKLNNTGKFCYKLGMYSKAEQSFNTALEQFNALSKEDQETAYGFDIVNTSVDLLSVYQRELEATKDFAYRDKAVKLINKARQWNEADTGSYDYSYNKTRINEFESVFKTTTTRDLKVSTVDIENIGRKLKAIPEEKDTLTMVNGLEKIINDLESMHKENPRNQKVNSLLAEACGSIAWLYVFQKQFAKTVDFAKRGLELDSTQTWIYSNLALGYLSQGMWPQAKEIYGKYKDFLADPDHSFKDVSWRIYML